MDPRRPRSGRLMRVEWPIEKSTSSTLASRSLGRDVIDTTPLMDRFFRLSPFGFRFSFLFGLVLFLVSICVFVLGFGHCALTCLRYVSTHTDTHPQFYRVLPRLRYWLLPNLFKLDQVCGFVALNGFESGFIGCYWVLLGFTGFYWVLLSSTGFYWDLLVFTTFYWVLQGLTGFYRVLLGFTEFYWVLLGFIGFDYISLGL